MKRVPKYVQELMKRAEYTYNPRNSEYVPGYTIRIYKATDYGYVRTLNSEVERLQKWVERQMPHDDLDVPTCIINYIPEQTHYHPQWAVITIFDPVMKEIEQYIPERKGS